jgi:hypothetical protein
LVKTGFLSLSLFLPGLHGLLNCLCSEVLLLRSLLSDWSKTGSLSLSLSLPGLLKVRVGFLVTQPELFTLMKLSRFLSEFTLWFLLTLLYLLELCSSLGIWVSFRWLTSLMTILTSRKLAAGCLGFAAGLAGRSE